jgi:uncharacterized protein
MLNLALALISFLKKEASAENGVGLFGALWRVGWVLANVGQHHRMLRLTRGPQAKSVLESYLRVVYRYTFPYLATNFSQKERVELLQSHYEFISKKLSGDFFTRVLDGSLVVWEQHIEGHHLSVLLAGPCPHREGDLTLVFRMDGVSIYKLAFSILNAALLGLPGGRAMYVGQVQGYPGQFAAIRTATHACHDVAPPDMLMHALFGLAGTLDIHMVAGVGLENCLSFQRLLQRETCFNYAEFWGRYMAQRSERGHHMVTLPLAEKPLEQVKANHRRRTFLKREFKRQVSAAVTTVMSPMVLTCTAVIKARKVSMAVI